LSDVPEVLRMAVSHELHHPKLVKVLYPSGNQIHQINLLELLELIAEKLMNPVRMGIQL
jgi:hypothetical protein